ncbi:unnamed protein product [Vicia faba]|uniref:Uncharacterized protein n=1 Tax=Vicia faba TaxID=3906 RepID=A0AAV1A9N2_VICFA|nr:unnamed protein product [Vicia faba]
MNFHYGLINNPECDDDDDIVDEYQDLKNTISEDKLSSIMKTLEDTDWKEEKRRSINVGKIIYDEIIDCAFKKETNSVLFASLISDLCIENGVHAEDDDGVLMNQGTIDLDSVKRFFKDEADEREWLEEEKFVGGDEAFVRRIIFKHMQQDMKLWRLYKEAFIYQRNMFELNFYNGGPSPPEFPDEILEPFMTDEPMYGQDRATCVAEDESFVHDNGDDLNGREKGKSNLSAAPPFSQSATRRFETKVKTCPSASLMANKSKRCTEHEGNEEEEVMGMKQVHQVVKYSKKRFKTTACRTFKSKFNILS